FFWKFFWEALFYKADAFECLGLETFFTIHIMTSKFTIYTKLFDEMIQNPEKIRHCLFVGSPGSGKTTAAQEFCKRWIGPQNQWIGRVLFLNASDERSLEAVRSKIFPFVRSTLTSIFQTSTSNSKVIVFDDCCH
ncbi:MAG: AAA family ATPase, partial [Chitinophagia bacterium]|nr:AAA family ATPase [Chitinophagia bacterium]